MKQASVSEPISPGSLWSASLYGLDGWPVWTRLPGDRRSAVLERLAASNLADSILIERLGIEFCARMQTECDDEASRSWYVRQGADEARHLDLFRSFAPGLEGQASSAEFGELLLEATAGSDRASRVLVTQVLLEAWGLRHYAALREHALHRPLADALTGILADEAEHQRSGREIYSRLADPKAPEHLPKSLSRLFDLVRVGPVTYQRIVEETAGPLTPGESASLRRALGHPERTGKMIGYLVTALTSAGLPWAVEALERQGCLEPCL